MGTMPGTVLSHSQAETRVIFKTTLFEGRYKYHHFTEKETETQKPQSWNSNPVHDLSPGCDEISVEAESKALGKFTATCRAPGIPEHDPQTRLSERGIRSSGAVGPT